jgi:hypothetical protein
MATTRERIENAKNALDNTKNLYNDAKRQYEATVAAFNIAKASSLKANSLLSTLKNTALDSAQIIQQAAQFAADPAQYAAIVNQPGVDPQVIIQTLTNQAVRELNVATIAARKAEREAQRANRALTGFQERINLITGQLEAAISTPSIDTLTINQEKLTNNLTKENTKKIALNGALIIKKNAKAVVKALGKSAAIYALSRVLSNQINRLANNVQELSELVDKTNELIQSVKTKQDVQKAKVARDAAINSLNRAENKVNGIRKTLRTLERLLFVLKLILFLLTLLPLKVRPKKVERIVKAILNLDAASVIVGVVKRIFDDYVAEIAYQKSRLLPISDVVDQALNNNLSSDEINDLLNNSGFGRLGPVDGVVYRGFTFAILEEDDPRFVVAGNKRRYAVAYDRSGFIVLRSTPSFTLDPEVLIDELRLTIDERNLEP